MPAPRARSAMSRALFTPLALAAALAAGGVQAQTSRSADPAAGERRTWIVQLRAAPLATYDGSIPGLPATRAAAGGRLDLRGAAAQAYTRHLDAQRAAVLGRVPGAAQLYAYNTVLAGFAATMTEAEAARLMTSADVLSVTPSEIHQLDTVHTADFLRLTAPGGLHTQLDALSRQVKGENVVLGIVDSGIWPEAPSFSDKVGPDGRPVPYHQPGTQVYGPPPAGWAGTCQTGEGFSTAMCNNKLIGARFFGADFNASGAVRAALEYNSPRDGASSGHGSHTASTAGGNEGVAVPSTVNGVTINTLTGIAPRARIAAYKVCWTATVSTQTGCYTADMVAAIDTAVADGVHVINFSISGTRNNFLDPVQVAFLNAAAAGVFVAASAGNSGPGNTVAHISPWVTTVGNSTFDRNQGGRLTLGNGTVVTGTSTNFFGAVNAPMVLSTSVAAAGQAAAAATCGANSLDPALAAGRIVVCDLGSTSTQAVRLAASAEVLRAGGAAMVLTNTTTATPATDPHTLPAIQVASTQRTAIRDYVTNAGAAASNAADHAADATQSAAR